jgi:hypothetical protein
MRVFLCSYNDFFLAIPMETVSSIFLYSAKTMEEQKNIVSLPLLFNYPDIKIHHGIILKKTNEINSQDNTILLSSEIECEKEIPDEDFYPIPKTFGVLRLSSFFSGMLFKNASKSAIYAGNLVLLLNPEQVRKLS